MHDMPDFGAPCMMSPRLLQMDSLGQFRFYVKDRTQIEHHSVIELKGRMYLPCGMTRLYKRCFGIIIAHRLIACATTCFWVLAL